MFLFPFIYDYIQLPNRDVGSGEAGGRTPAQIFPDFLLHPHPLQFWEDQLLYAPSDFQTLHTLAKAELL